MSNIAEIWGIRAGFAAYAVFSVAVVVSCAGLIRGRAEGVVVPNYRIFQLALPLDADERDLRREAARC
jgi:hypothetical protein